MSTTIERAHEYLAAFGRRRIDPRNNPMPPARYSYGTSRYEYDLSRVNDEEFLGKIDRIFRPKLRIITFERLEKYFSEEFHDPINDYSRGTPYVRLENTIPVCESDYTFAERVLFVTLWNNFERYMITNEHNAFCHATVSWLLQWPIDELRKLQERCSTFLLHFDDNAADEAGHCRACGVFEMLNMLICLVQEARNIFYVTIEWDGDCTAVPFIRFSHKALSKFYKTVCCVRNIASSSDLDDRNEFNDQIGERFFTNNRVVDTLTHLHHLLSREFWASEKTARRIRRTIDAYIRKDIACDLHKNISESLDEITRKVPKKVCFKYLTGVASTGKSTILNQLAGDNWTIFSRGKLGGYSAKTYDQITLTQLNFGLGSMVGDRMIGDRGFSDNPLWCLIMPFVDPKYHKDSHNFVENMLKGMSKLASESAVVFGRNLTDFLTIVDISSRLNKERMLRRGEGGDCHRGRIDYYVITQIMFYITNALIFAPFSDKHMKILPIPYTHDYSRLDGERHARAAREISAYFEESVKTYRDNLVSSSDAADETSQLESKVAMEFERFCRPNTDAFDTTSNFPHNAGIFK